MAKIDRQAIYERDGGICGFCGEHVPLELLHLDHIVPRGLGGPTTVENLRVAHRHCNISAGHKVRRERKQQGMKHAADEQHTVPVRMPAAIYNAIVDEAIREDRTVNRQIVRALREWLESKVALPRRMLDDL